MFSKISVKMTGRDINEENRASTPLELFFDLVYVVAIAGAASGLHHSLASNHFRQGFVGFSVALFGILWAWVNYTWFASAYDTDDWFFRFLTFVTIFGSLVMAVGIKDFFLADMTPTLGVVGYVIMRFALVLQWLRAASDDPEHRKSALFYALGITVIQILWVASLWAPKSIWFEVLIILIFCELLLPYLAEKATKGTTWHSEHIAERYGLMVIIILGEGILASTAAISNLTSHKNHTVTKTFLLGLGSTALVFLLFRVYFTTPWSLILEKNREQFGAFLFGYSHYFVFGSLISAAVGLQLVTDAFIESGAEGFIVTPLFALTILSISIGVFLLLLCFLRLKMLSYDKFNLTQALIAVFVTSLPILAALADIPIQWALFFSLVAPSLTIYLNKRDEQHYLDLKNE